MQSQRQRDGEQNRNKIAFTIKQLLKLNIPRSQQVMLIQSYISSIDPKLQRVVKKDTRFMRAILQSAEGNLRNYPNNK